MDRESSHTFGKWRSRLWPIQAFELKKMLPLLFLKFFVSLNYAILTCMKDTLVVTAKNSGAEVIPILKGWIVLPVAIIATLIYTKLSNVFKQSTLYYGTILFFIFILLSYAFVLYPNIDYFSPHSSADWLLNKFGVNYQHWIAVYRNWVHSLFFVTAELWAQLVIFILFWGFTNQITSVGEAKRSYTLFIAAGDLATLAAGPLVLYYAKKFSDLSFVYTLQHLIGYVIVFGLIIMGIFKWMHKHVLTDERLCNPLEVQKLTKKKTKLSLFKGIKHILSSKYLIHIALIVIGCGLAINMIEVTWKANLKILYPNSADYQAFIAKLTFLIGLVALIVVLFAGGNFLRKFGWLFSAQITPIVVGLTGLTFFILSWYKDSLPFLNAFGMSPLVIVVLFGAFQNIMSKVMKYSFFDSTKEIAYIPLDYESKLKGKAAIDVVGSRLGKSGSAWIQIALIDLVGMGSILNVTPYLFPIVFGMVVVWIYSTKVIHKELSKQEEEVPEAVSV